MIHSNREASMAAAEQHCSSAQYGELNPLIAYIHDSPSPSLLTALLTTSPVGSSFVPLSPFLVQSPSTFSSTSHSSMDSIPSLALGTTAIHSNNGTRTSTNVNDSDSGSESEMVSQSDLQASASAELRNVLGSAANVKSSRKKRKMTEVKAEDKDSQANMLMKGANKAPSHNGQPRYTCACKVKDPKTGQKKSAVA